MRFCSSAQYCRSRLTPGSGIGFFRISDPGSQTYIFESILTSFWVKSYIILWKLDQIFFFRISKIKIYNFVKFTATIKVWQLIFFIPLFSCCFWIQDPRTGIWDLGSGMGKKNKSGSGINIPDPQHCLLLGNRTFLNCRLCELCEASRCCFPYGCEGVWKIWRNHGFF